ncbi:hypothetical protein QE152_g37592 [Popillia japonica]|uniref:Uncharacterized protein n=1 Tax=Popillia japonica TaxID=7064 RepID=A0AAW1IA21_POPJA
METESTYEIILPLMQRIPGCDYASWQDIDSWMKDDDQYEITDEEIVALVNCNDNDIENQNEAPTVEPLRISHNDGVKDLETAIKYTEQQEEATGIDIIMLQKWRDMAAKKRHSSGTQTTIKNFFKSSQD